MMSEARESDLVAAPTNGGSIRSKVNGVLNDNLTNAYHRTPHRIIS